MKCDTSKVKALYLIEFFEQDRNGEKFFCVFKLFLLSSSYLPLKCIPGASSKVRKLVMLAAECRRALINFLSLRNTRFFNRLELVNLCQLMKGQPKGDCESIWTRKMAKVQRSGALFEFFVNGHCDRYKFIRILQFHLINFELFSYCNVFMRINA